MTMTTDYMPNPYAVALSAIIADALPDRVTLVDPDYSDELTPADVQRCIREGTDEVRESMTDWTLEAEYESIHYYAAECLPPWIAAMRDDEMVMEAVRETLWERDDSDPVAAMLRHTGSLLMRYRLDYDVAPSADRDAAAYDVAVALGLDGEGYLASREAILGMLAECEHYGGTLHIIWHGDAATVVDACDAIRYEQADPPTAIRWRDPSILVLDRWSGSGMDARISGTVTLPFDPALVDVDTEGAGYSWTEVAGPYEPAYDAHVDFPGWEGGK